MIVIAKAGPNIALVVTPLKGGQNPKIYCGGRAVYIPCLQRCDRLSLSAKDITITSQDTLTKQGIPITVTGKCVFKLGSTHDETAEDEVNDSGSANINAVRLAAEHFLGLHSDDIIKTIQSMMEGHQRSIIGSLSIEQISQERTTLSGRVLENTSSDAKRMGFVILSYTIKDISDNEEYIQNMKVNQIEVMQRQNKISIAKNRSEAAMTAADHELNQKLRVDKADQEKLLSNRDRMLAELKYREEVEKADAKAKGQVSIERAVVQQEVLAQQERQKLKIEEENYKLTELRALTMKLELEKRAMAEGNAAVIRSTKGHEAESIKTKSDAERIRLLGEAEGQALLNKQNAELHFIRQRAAAYREFGNASMAIQAIEALPKIAAAMAEPLSKTDKMVFINSNGDQNGGSGASTFMADFSKSMSTVTETVDAMTGVNLNRVLRGCADQLAGTGPLDKSAQLAMAAAFNGGQKKTTNHNTLPRE
mmetsp:Transcript_9344/g.28149  ORF Transcript_9344/g.28149 Transcript_9344/m.28149 type:complete len:479 (+) Transcript_9344:87-1523(+)|eukprot:CAMPEP_0198729010 /NCGR_PEP_ID=MMETSP1475-20131203/13396_1 /TAXON_ID= ORGANISM="Unidentified sp., Strain CCMP1999" /NCGR_SAMPLE_ID=MMETSP1475 /ASSEMBLY_ACC=CAM_ASM_001111 /LENGTH=478 /DNA_ID=CAMNT_0044491531 /DNA_START=32 /DNA_END=1468 /DNA_ORIENTATION=+